MLLFVACRLLCGKKTAVEFAEYSRKILRTFVSLLPTSYGSDSRVMNVHNLIHVADDVKHMNVPLTALSAYPSESCLGFVKSLGNKGAKPLAQIVRKLHSLYSNMSSAITTRYPLVHTAQICDDTQIGKITEISENCINSSFLNLEGFTITTKHPDNIIVTQTGKIVEIMKIYC